MKYYFVNKIALARRVGRECNRAARPEYKAVVAGALRANGGPRRIATVDKSAAAPGAKSGRPPRNASGRICAAHRSLSAASRPGRLQRSSRRHRHSARAAVLAFAAARLRKTTHPESTIRDRSDSDAKPAPATR